MEDTSKAPVTVSLDPASLRGQDLARAFAYSSTVERTGCVALAAALAMCCATSGAWITFTLQGVFSLFRNRATEEVTLELLQLASAGLIRVVGQRVAVTEAFKVALREGLYQAGSSGTRAA